MEESKPMHFAARLLAPKSNESSCKQRRRFSHAGPLPDRS